MDLEFLGFPALAEGSARAYGEACGDRELHDLLDSIAVTGRWYGGRVESCAVASRRWMRPRGKRRVRPHVATSGWPRATREDGDRPSWSSSAGCQEPASRPCAGRRGSERLCDPRLGSDAQQRLARVPRFQHSRSGIGTLALRCDSTRRTYGVLFEGARESLAAGRGVVLDATFLDPSDLREALAVARAANVPVTFLECRAREEEVLRRLRDRQKRPDEVSDATEEILSPPARRSGAHHRSRPRPAQDHRHRSRSRRSRGRRRPGARRRLLASIRTSLGGVGVGRVRRAQRNAGRSPGAASAACPSTGDELDRRGRPASTAGAAPTTGPVRISDRRGTREFPIGASGRSTPSARRRHPSGSCA